MEKPIYKQRKTTMSFQEERMNEIFLGIPPHNPTKKEKKKLEIAKEFAIKNGCVKKAWHCGMIEKNGKIIAISVNVNTSYVTRFGKMSYCAECCCIYSVNVNNIKNATFYIVKAGKGKNDNYMNSAPCHVCFRIISKLLKKKTFSKVIFSMPGGKIHSFTKNDL